jgi:hypothetical protein
MKSSLRLRKRSEHMLHCRGLWDLEWELQQHGFDCCYDERLYDRLYDRLEHDNAETVQLHFCADLAY